MRSDVKLIFPNPKTSGNARYTYLAAWGAADKADGKDKAKTEQFMTQFLKNVEVFDTGGRGATTTFAERGLGDVLISFESEVNNIRKQYEAQGFEVVIPKTNIWPSSRWRGWIKRAGERHRESDKSLSQLPVQPAGAGHHHRLLLPREQPRRNEQTEGQIPADRAVPGGRSFRLWPEVMKTHFASGGELDKLLAAGRK